MWPGGAYAAEVVERVEFQTRREPLREMGIRTAEEAIARAGDVFTYCAGRWLRLVDLSTATRRERCELDPAWSCVQASKVAAGAAAARRVPAERHALKLDQYVNQLTGLLVGLGAMLGDEDPATVIRKVGILVSERLSRTGRDFAAEVAARRLDYGNTYPVRLAALLPRSTN